MAQGTTRPIAVDIDTQMTANSDNLVSSQRATRTYIDNKIYPTRLYDSSGSYSYCGVAFTGSLTSDSVWSITRLDINLSGSVTLASASNAIWDNRYTTIYS
jgi:hypothetical protein